MKAGPSILNKQLLYNSSKFLHHVLIPKIELHSKQTKYPKLFEILIYHYQRTLKPGFMWYMCAKSSLWLMKERTLCLSFTIWFWSFHILTLISEFLLSLFFQKNYKSFEPPKDTNSAYIIQFLPFTNIDKHWMFSVCLSCCENNITDINSLEITCHPSQTQTKSSMPRTEPLLCKSSV